MITHTILSKRLQSVAALVGESDRLIDVGSDHGYIAAFVLENKMSFQVIATDIHLLPADRARRYLNRQGYSEQSNVLCTDGLNGIDLLSSDTIVIAGMGGLEIVRILSDAMRSRKDSLPISSRYILQPQRSYEEVRSFLCAKGFSIQRETISIDRNRIYVIILVEYIGTPYELSLVERNLGPCIIRDRQDGFILYMKQQRDQLRKRSKGRAELENVVQYIDNILSTVTEGR